MLIVSVRPGQKQGRNEFVIRLQPSEAIYMKLTVSSTQQCQFLLLIPSWHWIILITLNSVSSLSCHAGEAAWVGNVNCSE